MKPVIALRHVPHEDLGTLADAFRQAGVPFQLLDLFREVPPQFDLEQIAGLVVMGGPMNVDETDRYPFLAAEVAWIQAAVRYDVPVLGICLGSQLLAKALGSKVYPNKIKEIGWYPLEVLPAARGDTLFGGCPTNMTVFQWHGDTFDLPAGAVQLARSPLCENQAFRYGRAAYGLQFHLEMTGPMIEDWLCESGGCAEIAGLPYIDPAEIRRRTREELPTLNEHARGIFGEFAKLCSPRSHGEHGAK